MGVIGFSGLMGGFDKGEGNNSWGVETPCGAMLYLSRSRSGTRIVNIIYHHS